MTKPEPEDVAADPSAPAPAGDDLAQLVETLACTYDSRLLFQALWLLVRERQATPLACALWNIVAPGEPTPRADKQFLGRYYAPFHCALIARLCMDGRADLAEALHRRTSGGGRQNEPDPPEEWIGDPPNPHLTRWLREIAGPAVHPERLAQSLIEELRMIGDDAEASAVTALLQDAVLRRPSLVRPLPPPQKLAPPRQPWLAPEIHDLVPAGVEALARALVLRFYDEGESNAAALISYSWTQHAAGPIVAAGSLGASLVEKLRSYARPDLDRTADALAALLEAEGIGVPDAPPVPPPATFPDRPMLRWFMKTQGMNRPGVTQDRWSVFERRLHGDGREALAKRVKALLADALISLRYEWMSKSFLEQVEREEQEAASTSGSASVDATVSKGEKG